MTRWTVLCGRCLLVGGMVLGAAGAAANCAPQCATTSSVTTMAGGLPHVLTSADGVAFVGSKLSAPGARAVPRLAREALQFAAGMKRERWKMLVNVQADPWLSGTAAQAQTKGRMQNLVRALAAAGIEECHINDYCKPRPRH